jgi:hypothetical protein
MPEVLASCHLEKAFRSKSKTVSLMAWAVLTAMIILKTKFLRTYRTTKKKGIRN